MSDKTLPPPPHDPNALTVSALLADLGHAGSPVLIDICLPEDAAADPYTLPGAIRGAHDDIAPLIDATEGRKAVVICQKGLKLSQGVAAWLRTEGHDARYLQGGMYAWRDDPRTMRVPLGAIAAAGPAQGLWVAAQRPGPEVLAALWLLRRWLDRNARVLFVAPDTIGGVAERFGATELTDFAALQARFDLNGGCLARMPELARSAEAVCTGLSALHMDDTALMEAALPVMDALYRTAQLEARP